MKQYIRLVLSLIIFWLNVHCGRTKYSYGIYLESCMINYSTYCNKQSTTSHLKIFIINKYPSISDKLQFVASNEGINVMELNRLVATISTTLNNYITKINEGIKKYESLINAYQLKRQYMLVKYYNPCTKQLYM